MISRIATLAALALLFPLFVASPAKAQVWDSPMLVSPGAPAGLGVLLVDPGAGTDIGVLATWRADPAPFGLGWRAGLVEAADGDLALTAGVDFSGALTRIDGEVPIDLIWFSGVGAGFNDVIVSVPLGIAAGLEFSGEAVTFRPWLAPRVFLDAFLESDERTDSELDLGAAVEIGLDLQFDGPWTIRAAGSFGDRDGVAIGVVFPVG